MAQPDIILIPGLGADRDLFYPQQEYFGDRLLVVEDAGDDSLWQKSPSMAVAAEAFLSRITKVIPAEGPYILGGMSFGGSLAMEIVRVIERDQCVRPPAAVALIASNRTSESISRGFRFNRAVGSKLPQWLVRRSLRGLSGIFASREGLPDHDRRRLREMANRANLDQLMWGAKAISLWSCGEEETKLLEIPIQQMHGRGDWVIPIYPSHVTTTLESGRHLITWTHRSEVNDWLENLTITVA